MAKKIQGYIKLQVPAGAANPSPPIGPALGQAGLNIMEFCKAFNASTQDQDKGIPIPTVITVFVDKSFSFETKTPPASYYHQESRKAGQGRQNDRFGSGRCRDAQAAREIAEIKMADMNANDIDSAVNTLSGSARSMGIQVRG